MVERDRKFALGKVGTNGNRELPANDMGARNRWPSISIDQRLLGYLHLNNCETAAESPIFECIPIDHGCNIYR